MPYKFLIRTSYHENELVEEQPGTESLLSNLLDGGVEKFEIEAVQEE